MEHVFGFDPATEILGRGERLCTENAYGSGIYTKIVHVLLVHTPDNVTCATCGESFLEVGVKA